MKSISVTPNTNEELRGKKPRAHEKDFNFEHQICDNCRSKWTEKAKVHCDLCAAKKALYATGRKRKVKDPKKRDRNPSMIDIFILPTSGDHTLDEKDVRILADIGGTVVNIRKVSVALHVIGQDGKDTITVFRDKPAPKVAQPALPSATTRAKLKKGKSRLFERMATAKPAVKRPVTVH
jgi:hypothetical protein